jgi:5-methyltetrahydrofolate--homocysteine methyltransferase
MRSGETLIADGATGTLLIGRHEADPHCPEAMNLTHPERVEAVARAYRDAGAEVLQTNTFGASPIPLEAAGLAPRTAEVNAAAATAARRALAGGGYLLGSCGPARRPRPGRPVPTDAEVVASFETQIAALLEARVDGLAFETMTDLKEAILAVSSARRLSQSIPIFVMMVFRMERQGPRTLAGDAPRACANELAAAGADVIGMNCGTGTAVLPAVARELRNATDRPIALRPSAGIPALREGSWIYPESPRDFADALAASARDGAALVGGCCGTTPGHIRALAEAMMP